jgi:hypothetical protein
MAKKTDGDQKATSGEEKEVSTAADGKKVYRVSGIDFRFRKKTYPEGSEIKLTDAEYEAEKTRVKLIPVK